jgi:branched-subunit amino acid transport protein
MRTWIAIVGVGLGSYILRLVPLLVGERVRWSARVDRAIGHAGLAALSALVVGGLQHHDGGGRPGAMLWALGALATAALIARRGGSMLRIVVAGLAAYWLPTLLIAGVS